MVRLCITSILGLLTASWAWSKPMPADKVRIHQGILDELKQVPPPTPSGGFLDAVVAALPPFTDKQLAKYEADYPSLDELKKALAKQPDKHPLRAATLNAVEALKKGQKFLSCFAVSAPLGKMNKIHFLEKQRDLGLVIYELEEAFKALQEASKQRAKETSSRWQAHFDYVSLVCLARFVFINEHSYAIGVVRADRLPDLPPNAKGWRLAPTKKLSAGPEVRAKNKQADEIANKILRDHPNTPWAAFAQRELLRPRGLEWRVQTD
jgi:hypothetical protein